MDQVEYLERLSYWLMELEAVANGALDNEQGIVYNGQRWDILEEETDRLLELVKEGTR